MIFSTRNFNPLSPLASQFPNFAIEILLFRLKVKTHCSHRHIMHLCYKIFYTTWMWGVACQKQRLGPKLEGAGLGEHPKNWDPLLILATVRLSSVS